MKIQVKLTKKENETNEIKIEKLLNQLNNIYFYNYAIEGYDNLNEMSNQSKLWIAYWLLKDDYSRKNITNYTSDELLNEIKKIFKKKFYNKL